MIIVQHDYFSFDSLLARKIVDLVKLVELMFDILSVRRIRNLRHTRAFSPHNS